MTQVINDKQVFESESQFYVQSMMRRIRRWTLDSRWLARVINHSVQTRLSLILTLVKAEGEQWSQLVYNYKPL